MTDIWPFRPLIGCVETLEFFTEVNGSRTSEERIDLRSAPRQFFDYTVRLDSRKFARAKQLARQNAGQMLYVPVWGEQVQSPTLHSSTTVITMDTTAGDWRDDDPVLIWQDDENYVVKVIDSHNDTSITLTTSLGQTLVKPAIVPVRESITPQGFRIRRDTSYSEVQAIFQVLDNIDLSADYVSSYPQYLSLDVITERTLLITDIEEDITRVSEYIDNGFGPVIVENSKNYANFGQMIAFCRVRNAEVWQHRLWLHSLKGKQQTFWLPTFNNDLVLQASFLSGATTISVKSIGETGNYLNKHIMFLLNDGNYYFRKITNAVVGGGGNDTLTMSSSLGVDVAPADIDLFCFISLCRLNSDSINFEHQLAIDTYISVPVIEVPDVI